MAPVGQLFGQTQLLESLATTKGAVHVHTCALLVTEHEPEPLVPVGVQQLWLQLGDEGCKHGSNGGKFLELVALPGQSSM
jgi:hypothetical protein